MRFKTLSESCIRELQSIVAPERLSTGESYLDLHSRDQSQHPPCRPEAVIWPVNKTEVSQLLTYANTHMIPVTGWGSGSSLEGNPVPVNRGLVLNFGLMNKIVSIKEEDFQADVEPGVIYQDLNDRLRHKGLFFPPDPGARATIGGMIANNASGTRTVYYGSTRNHVLRLSIALANGEMIDIGTRASKTSSGYDLLNLFIGSEGTLGLVVEATIRLVGLPAEFSTAVVSFPTIENTGRAVFEIIRSGLGPAALELLTSNCVKIINQEKNLELPVSPTLFMEFQGPTKNLLSDRLAMVRQICEQEACSDFRSGIERSERETILKARYELAEMIKRKHPDRSAMVIDVAVPVTTYPPMIAFAKQEVEKIGIPGYIFSHAGDGNLHVLLLGEKKNKEEWAVIDRINHHLVSKALSFGGTATGEHGVGIGKRKFMEAEHGKSLEWMKKIKALFDPNGILNPGKIFF